MKLATLTVLIVAVVCLVWMGCDESNGPTTSVSPADGMVCASIPADLPAAEYPPPPGQVTIGFASQNLTFWPYTGVDFSGTPQDPINLVFYGKADPRDIRAALLSLDGDRSAYPFPDMPPWNATWDDAIGDVQAGYGDAEGWAGGVVQLACGDYGPFRFHLRLFKLGEWTVGNAHFEVLIPGTADHEVLGWEQAEQFVMVDMERCGLLDESVPMGFSQYINQEPFRAIPAMIYNEMPVEIRDYIGGPLGDIGDEEVVPVPTDGIIPIFNLAERAPRVPEVRYQAFDIQYGQFIPRPFCSSGPYDIVYVEGGVSLIQTAELTEDGTYSVTFRAQGELTVTPIDVSTYQPSGEPLTAIVKEHHDGLMTDHVSQASALLLQNIVPAADPGAGSLVKRLRVNSNGPDGFQILLKCPGDDEYLDVTDQSVCQPDLTSVAEEDTNAR